MVDIFPIAHRPATKRASKPDSAAKAGGNQNAIAGPPCEASRSGEHRIGRANRWEKARVRAPNQRPEVTVPQDASRKCQLQDSRISRRRDAHKVRVVLCRVRVAKIYAIQGIELFESKLAGEALLDRETFHHAKVQRGRTRSEERPSARDYRRSRRRWVGTGSR
jgi:hypothetical protein